tara:strand:+ start:435 stop:764 length:330 start_codon:yes stop_codon:yes gene_type:complete
MATSDPTNPSYYGFGDDAVIECVDYIESHAFDFLEGNIIKYVTRYEGKNGVEDLKKASWYLDRLIKREEGKAMSYDSSLYKSILKAKDEDIKLPTSSDVDGERWSTCDC